LREALILDAAVSPAWAGAGRTLVSSGRSDLLQQSGADQLIDNLSGGFTLKVRRQFNSAIIALRSRGQNDELRIGKF